MESQLELFSTLMHTPNPDHQTKVVYIRSICERARLGAQALSRLTADELNAMLEDIAVRLEQNAEEIYAANRIDLKNAEADGLSSPMVRRLSLGKKELQLVIDGVRQVKALPQPLGENLKDWTRPNGIKISKVRVPLGVIGIIYESRPNVTIDAAVLCLKTGNSVVLRGGREAVYSNRALVEALSQSTLVPEGAVQLVGDQDRELVPILCQQSGLLDLLIPRGGKSLIEAVVRDARVPVIKHADGICSIFVHESADFEMANSIILNAKVQKPGVCNAVETVLVDRSIAAHYLPKLIAALAPEKVEIRGDSTVVSIAKPGEVSPATEADYRTEYLDLILAVRVVDGVEGALKHLNEFSSKHSDAIIAQDEKIAEIYLNAVDSATVYWNASTRFTDGGEFGFGAEIGISTDKMHARGPMGLEELTSYKYQIRGTGQIR